MIYNNLFSYCFFSHRNVKTQGIRNVDYQFNIFHTNLMLTERFKAIYIYVDGRENNNS